MNKSRNDIATMVIAFAITLFIIVCCVLILIEVINNPNNITFGGW